MMAHCGRKWTGRQLLVSGLLMTVLMVCLGISNGKLIFKSPLHGPRIYENAPPGVYVTTVAAYDPQVPNKSVGYNLLDVKDHAHFAIDPVSGNVTTAKEISRRAKDNYQVIAVAISQGETKLQQLEIEVTEYNEFGPQFADNMYRGELHVRSPLQTFVLRVRAQDEDPMSYNAEVYFLMEENNRENTKYFLLDPKKGEVVLARPLNASQPKLTFRIIAEDGGSPKRWDDVPVEVLVKTISEPQDVRALNATGTSVDVCWSRPRYGQVQGYLIKYREVAKPQEGPSFLNITSDAKSKCTTLQELRPWTDYEFRVYGWNKRETGQGSVVTQFGTRPDYCLAKICQHGKCHSINEEPGYWCECNEGYYNDVCDKFNPCSLNPCDNFGVCRNTSHNMYKCDCLSGFSGKNCTIFNPCALRPSPCLNDGRCESTASHTYQCYCKTGYYGKTCQFFNPCALKPCVNGGTCQNMSQTEYVCRCPPGYSGKQCEVDIDECASSPCKHGGVCRDGINAFYCQCPPGYRGKRCHVTEHCTTQIAQTTKGTFRWNSTAHGRMFLVECPFGAMYYEGGGGGPGYAKRKCFLLSNGTVSWGATDSSACREEGFKLAEDLTGELWMLTEDPNSLSAEKFQETAKQIENILQYAVYDKKIAHNMLTVISNMLAVNDTILEQGDQNGTASAKLMEVVDKFTSEVKIERGETISLETENLAIKAIAWDPEMASNPEDILTYTSVHHKSQTRREKRNKEIGLRSRAIPENDILHKSIIEEREEETSDADSENAAQITIPLEALLVAHTQTAKDIRVKFVAYKNDKFFRPKKPTVKASCEGRRGQKKACPVSNEQGPPAVLERPVLQASISNITVTNLSEPVIFVLPTPSYHSFLCVFWKEQGREWSTEGILTNQTGNITMCYSSHLTAFSILFDPTPDLGIPEEHQQALSIISYIGCALSMLGLLLTIITYSLFRCLNRDHPGKILLNLCVSMLLMNAAFVAGSQKGLDLAGLDICVAVAVLIHYFLLTSLAWMCVEATNMYQLLIHVFASTETRFMVKRFILAWGVPLIIVGVTVGVDIGEYHLQNEYCMLSPANPYVYYISYLGPSCLILIINLTVFIMVTRVLFTPRMTCKAGAIRTKGERFTITAAQVRGAFSVMVLLGVTWVFGAFAIGEAKLIFQYVFCVANSLQGFLIFVVRCLQYPEARIAWAQLIKTGTLKKHRGVAPPGSSWAGNSNSSHKQNGHSTASQMGSGTSDTTSTLVFNSNYWNNPHSKESSHYNQKHSIDFSSARFPHLAVLKNINLQQEEKQMPKNKTFSRSTSESSPELEKIDLNQNGHFTFGVGPKVVVEMVDKDEVQHQHPKDDDDRSKDTDMSSLATEPQQGRYGSFGSIGYIDEEEQERKLAAERRGCSHMASLFSQCKLDSPPEIEKQNSWPRTLSSFLSGKERPDQPVSQDSNQSTLPRRCTLGPTSDLSDLQHKIHSCHTTPLKAALSHSKRVDLPLCLHPDKKKSISKDEYELETKDITFASQTARDEYQNDLRCLAQENIDNQQDSSQPTDCLLQDHQPVPSRNGVCKPLTLSPLSEDARTESLAERNGPEHTPSWLSGHKHIKRKDTPCVDAEDIVDTLNQHGFPPCSILLLDTASSRL